MEALNIVQIEEKIRTGLENVKTPDDLLALQKWAKKAKKQTVVQPYATSFKKVYYSYETSVRSHGSGKFLYRKANFVDYTSFVFMGLEIKLPDSKYTFDEADFESHKIWVDKKIKYGGTEYFPKQPITVLFGINLEQMFFEYLRNNKFFVVTKWGKKYFLCNDRSNAKKLLQDRRLTQFDKCNSPVIPISKDYVDYLKLEVLDWEYFHPTNNTTIDDLKF